MDVTVKDLGKGSRVFYKQDDSTWVLGELLSAPGATCSVRLLSGKTVQAPAASLSPANPEVQDGIHDLTQLSSLNEPAILHNLDTRYARDNIYSNAGPVLVAVNPCKALPLYTPEIANKYKGGASQTISGLDPHIYLTAANAFRSMARDQRSQSLVVNGESGAGKTETTKKAMQYFAALAGGTGVEDQVLETNPILEAFGNAKTLRNHNSSRFGKLIEIHFNQTHHICGARVRTYLLEKSRVVRQLQGERSYHIFYQLLKGCPQEDRQRYGLPASVLTFNYLKNSGCTEIPGVDDAEDFRQLRRSMADVGISVEHQDAVFTLLSGLLWLGNIEFKQNSRDDGVSVRTGEAVTTAAKLLGVSEDSLCRALTSKKIVTKDELIIKLLNMDEANDARDALAKAVYSGIFSWVVDRINLRLDMGRRGSGQYIAILDIYGFEQFQVNSFEQLCINYANERLQQQFTRHLFTLEQEEYEREGIDWTKVEFVDNQDCVDVIEAVPPRGLGVMAVLDSQCKFPKATDATLHTSLKEALANNPNFSTNPRSPADFSIRHFAGHVQYNTTGFLDKNKDTLSADLIQLMHGSGSTLLQEVGAAISRDDGDKRSGQTVSSRFVQQLRELIVQLDTTGLHFVRCIKPNTALQPDLFESKMIVQQLRCCGVLEVARVSRAGFPTRYPHEQFVERYQVLLPPGGDGQHTTSGTLDKCQQLLRFLKVEPGQYQLGRTKVFFKPGVLGQVEDTWARMQAGAVVIQASVRMWVVKKRYRAMLAAATQLQSSWRSRVVRVMYTEMLRRHRAATMIQRMARGHAARKSYVETRRATMSLQMACRLWAFHKRVQRRVKARQEAEEAARRAEEERARREREESFEAMKHQFGVTDTTEVKRALSVYVLARDEFGMGEAAAVRSALTAWGVCQEAGVSDPGELKAALITYAALKDNDALDVDGEDDGGAVAAADGLHSDLTLPPGPPAIATSNGSRGLRVDIHDASTSPMVAASELQTQVPPGATTSRGASRLNSMAGTAAGMGAGAIAGLAAGGFMANGVGGVETATADGAHAAGAVSREAELEQDLSRLQKQLQLEKSLRERYAEKLEEQALDWMEQVRTLQEYIQSIRGALENTPHELPPMPDITIEPGSPHEPRGQQQMQRQTTTSTTPSPLASPAGPFDGLPPRRDGPSPTMTPAAAQAAKEYRQLASEFDRVTPFMEDDLSFIQEVSAGAIVAPDMDPYQEYERLRRKYDVWQKAFRDKLKAAQSKVRKTDGRPPRPGVQQYSSSNTMGSVDVSRIPDLAQPDLLEHQAAMPGPQKKKSGLKALFKGF